MNDPPGVRVGERLGDVAEDRDHVVDGEGPGGEALPERLTVHVRHGEVGEPLHIAGGEHRDDIRLLERRREEDLALEALGVDPLDQVGAQDLDDHLATEAGLVGQEDARHPPAAELALENEDGTEMDLQLDLEISNRSHQYAFILSRSSVVQWSTTTGKETGPPDPVCGPRRAMRKCRPSGIWS